MPLREKKTLPLSFLSPSWIALKLKVCFGIRIVFFCLPLPWGFRGGSAISSANGFSESFRLVHKT